MGSVIKQQCALLEEGNRHVELVLVLSFLNDFHLVAAAEQVFADADDSHSQRALRPLLLNFFRFVVSFCVDGDAV